MKYLQTLWRNLCEQPVLSGVSVAGTALAIFLIMTVVMIDGTKTESFYPESHRDRMLYASWCSAFEIEKGVDWNSNGAMSEETGKTLYKGLESAEAVSLYYYNVEGVPVEVKGQPPVIADRRECDADFFRIFDYTFISGKPFTQADFEAGANKAVVSESLARRLFGTSDAVGRDFSIKKTPFTVSGVVKDVSTLASKAYADVWVPYTSFSDVSNSIWANGVMGVLSAAVLVKEGVSKEEAKAECDRRLNEYNKQIVPTGWEIMSRQRPYDQLTEVNSPWANWDPDVEKPRREKAVLIALLLLVPAINLSSMTGSRLRQRSAEIGVRRAYGATKWSIVRSLLVENLAVTLIAGVIALAASVLFAWLFSADLFAPDYKDFANAPSVDLTILLHFSTFGWALLFCFVLNLLSTGIPAWKAARVNVVNALKN